MSNDHNIPFRFHLRVILEGGVQIDVNPRTNNIHAAIIAAKTSLVRPSDYLAVRVQVLDMNISDTANRVVWSQDRAGR